nr:MAG TPA_asm: hypothetical protein [Caudoviricetes sp.]DAO36925.1 MAG TPA: hypothetical protein [Caudoviricetes sp.]
MKSFNRLEIMMALILLLQIIQLIETIMEKFF